MKKHFKRAVASLSAVAMLVQGPIAMTSAQTMTPSQLITSITEEVDFDAFQEINSAEFLASFNASVTGFQGFEFDLTGSGEGGFNIDVEVELIEFFADGSGEVISRYQLMNSDGEYEEVQEGPETFAASAYLKDGMFYSYDGTTEPTVEDLSGDMTEFFAEYEEGWEELKQDFAESQLEITDFFNEEITGIIDNHFTVTEDDSSYTLSINEDFDPQAFVEDIRGTDFYDVMMGDILGGNETRMDPAELRDIAEDLMTVFVGFFKEFNLTFMKDSYILQGANFDFRIAAVDVFDIIHRANEMTDEAFISPDELSMYVMMLRDLLITVDGGYEMTNINGDVTIEVPAFYDNARLIEPTVDDEDDFTTYEEPLDEDDDFEDFDNTTEEVTFEDITIDEETVEETTAE